MVVAERVIVNIFQNRLKKKVSLHFFSNVTKEQRIF